MAIVDLDNVPAPRRRRGDPAVIAALIGATAVLALAMWATAPQPQAIPIQPAAVPSAAPAGAPPTTTVWNRSGSTVVALVPPAGPIIGVQPSRTLVLPPWASGVDLFEIPDRLTNENLSWTLRNVIHIRGGTGLSSVEGPAMITWTENGFQYWMLSPTRSTDELVDIANGLR